MPTPRASIYRWAMAAFAAPMAALAGIALLTLYNAIHMGAEAIIGAFWQMVLVFFFVVPVSLVLSWPMFWVIQRIWQRELRPSAYWPGLLTFGATFAVVLGVWYSTHIAIWLLAAAIIGLTVNGLAFMGVRSSSNNAMDSDTTRSPLRAPYGARHRGR